MSSHSVSAFLRFLAIVHLFGGVILALHHSVQLGFSALVCAHVIFVLASARDRIADLDARLAALELASAPAAAEVPRERPPEDPEVALLRASLTALGAAQDHHFAKRFSEARSAYLQLIEDHPDTKAATVARAQLVNLRGA